MIKVIEEYELLAVRGVVPVRIAPYGLPATRHLGPLASTMLTGLIRKLTQQPLLIVKKQALQKSKCIQ